MKVVIFRKARGGPGFFSILRKIAAMNSDEGGPTMVGSDARKEILKQVASRLAKNTLLNSLIPENVTQANLTLGKTHALYDVDVKIQVHFVLEH